MATLPQDIRSGTVLGPSQAWVQGAKFASVNGLMAQADANNPAYSATVAIAAAFDAQGLTFIRQASITWVGGGNAPDDTSPPKISTDFGAPPTFVRVEMDLPAAVSIGADISVS